ncbi:aminomethyl-transferring glycine dehydrogenase subunit GcvPA [Halobacterium noricense]|uniref:aminomethyl-transferring glycine dehydrogenase subunit GcvPA n=1 Tax=Halobacterium noricense TaxID=223182 RepID=UPI001E6029BC|nr:aminomethyl-transferring glycine dehydrogenase subunit GcvPA [Halobacterium noricense]UHH26838.1 aminomethyl-transferring glycine dehydrogenase subunit GcvPA [Halobacterium noricense]
MTQQIQDTRREHRSEGTPFAPHTEADVEAMLDAINTESIEALFDVPRSVQFDGSFGIESASEQAVVRDVSDTLARNDQLTEFLGRGRYDHYVPSLIDTLSLRSEFLTSYTQYQPEIAQGFLQALFEYQSMLVELTGLEVANCSMYDAATALGEAALLADRVRGTSGSQVLVSDLVREERLSVLENYLTGTELTIETYPTAGGTTDPTALADHVTDETVMVYVENPTSVGTVEGDLSAAGDVADEHDATFCLGTDPVALALLEEPATVGADVVVGDASVLGLSPAYGLGLGLFACREDYLRQVPGRLVGVSEDANDNRAYTLTLQTREQHIRRERATSNICTNQAWVALRTAIHVTWLGATGLVDLAEECVELPRELAADLDDIEGVTAPVHDQHHLREFLAETRQDAERVVADLESAGFAVHAVDDHRIQVCITDANRSERDEFVQAVTEVVA